MVTYAGGYLSMDGTSRGAPVLSVGATYIFDFDVSHASMNDRNLKFSLSFDGQHAGGEEYLDGVVKDGVSGSEGARISIFLEKRAANPDNQLYYYLAEESGRGNTEDMPMELNFDKDGDPSAICAEGHKGPLCR
jgi:hypothetical protein